MRLASTLVLLLAVGLTLLGCNPILGIRSHEEAAKSEGGSQSEAGMGTDASEAGLLDVSSESVGTNDGPTTGATPTDAVADAKEADATTVDSGTQDGSAGFGPDACTSACTRGLTQCGSGVVQTCQQVNGCTQWVTTATCGINQDCTLSGVDAGAIASCACKSSVCTEVGKACQDAQTLATCEKDADGCFYSTSTSSCSMPMSCSGMAPNAACSLTCTNSCMSGQTSCVSGSLATCTLGSNGCYSYGTPVACGTRQSCGGAGGSAACVCNTDPVCTAAGSTCANSTTLATCSKDSQNCVYESSASTCNNGACSAGACCANACSGPRCASTDSVTSCTVGTNGCLQLGSTVPCGATTPLCTNGTCGQPPSCQTSGAGTTNCGASSESCCTSYEVAGGTYDRTYVNAGGGATGQADPATVSTFRLDKYDVTVGRFRPFVAAWNSGWTPAAGSGKHTHLNNGQGLTNSGSPGTYEPGWATSDNASINPTNANLACEPSYATWTPSVGSQENLPINCVNWAESYAFCIWDGGFLPTEAEWEYAAAAGDQQREYPWGSTDPGSGNAYAIYGCYYPAGSGTCSNVSNIAPVGTTSSGAGYWGQLDLAGNVFQWSADWDDLNETYADPCVDCAYLTLTDSRVIRGGDFTEEPTTLLPPYRANHSPAASDYILGLRCARTP
jgi:formylglycine-generating enzyme required for sulfatase activity